ncbi:hypothetical protein HYT24_02960 [Candidatus Pacearchaeota archaeon]|nr:hypothetical protein [Candidatus Pacearchaeota archaeon]
MCKGCVEMSRLESKAVHLMPANDNSGNHAKVKGEDTKDKKYDSKRKGDSYQPDVKYNSTKPTGSYNQQRSTYTSNLANNYNAANDNYSENDSSDSSVSWHGSSYSMPTAA